jgi:predicted nucleic acid-binding protein
MHIIGMLSDPTYLPIAKAIDDEKIDAMISVISITELIKILGKKDPVKAKITIRYLKSSKIHIQVLDTAIAESAGELRLKYNIPTADALIGATAIIIKADHIFTSDRHFNALKAVVKPIDIKKMMKIFKSL